MAWTLTWPVLIEPLWNWNIYEKQLKENANSINRTFMELKLKTKNLQVTGTAY